MTDRLPTSYVEARASFLAAAEAAGARLDHSQHPRQGREGEDLFVDVAELGGPAAQDAVLIVSGTHGVEGYLGSALQYRHLASTDPSSTASLRLVFVHALNPFGFSWVRRVNEDNVDLNRNFIDWTKPRPANAAYNELAAALVPDDWSDETQERTLTELLQHAENMGLADFQKVVSGGQYTHPTGLFFGGDRPAWSNDWMRAFLSSRLAGAARAVILDIHTGLGDWGHCELISSAPPDSPTYERQRAWWGNVANLDDGSSVSSDVAGDWLGAAPAVVPDTEVTGVALEYGTVDEMTVVQSLRADAVLHAHGDPAAPDAADVRAQVRAAFLDDAPAWLENCASQYDEIVAIALDRLS